jgi:acetyltransferase-like isoleucine patch superfamily enzyme
MNRKEQLTESSQKSFYESIMEVHETLDNAFLQHHNRSLPLNETFVDRWERAKKLGFGDKTSIYDSSVVIGEVKVGMNVWIGPFTIIDGSGKISIGDYCTISAGVHIYTHDNVKQTLTSGAMEIDRTPVVIGNNVYVGPNAIITKGVTIGNSCVIGANALVNRNVPEHSIVMGQPGRVVGKVELKDGKPVFVYHNK